jgi:hypothetical protein
MHEKLPQQWFKRIILPAYRSMGTTMAQPVFWLGCGLEDGGIGVPFPKNKIGFSPLRSIQT